MEQRNIFIKPERNSLLSQTFDALKWILALLVVCDHFIRAALMPHAATKIMPVTVAVSDFVVAFIKDYQVPLFFLMSGYLFCSSFKFCAKEYRRKIKSRLYSLGIPYLIFIVYGAAVTLLADYLLMGHPSGLMHHPIEMLTGFNLKYPINVPLWYIRDLMVLCLAAPLIHLLLQKSRGWILLAAALWYIFSVPVNTIIHFAVGAFFFSAGYLLRMYGTDIVHYSRKMLPVLLPTYLILATVLMMGWIKEYPINIWLKNFNICLSVPMMLAIVSYLVERKKLPTTKFLVSATFFVYLTHHPLRRLFIYLFNKHWPETTDVLFIIVLILTTAAMVAILMLLYAMLRRHCPKFTAFITGARISG